MIFSTHAMRTRMNKTTTTIKKTIATTATRKSSKRLKRRPKTRIKAKTKEKIRTKTTNEVSENFVRRTTKHRNKNEGKKEEENVEKAGKTFYDKKHLSKKHKMKSNMRYHSSISGGNNQRLKAKMKQKDISKMENRNMKKEDEETLPVKKPLFPNDISTKTYTNLPQVAAMRTTTRRQPSEFSQNNDEQQHTRIQTTRLQKVETTTTTSEKTKATIVPKNSNVFAIERNSSSTRRSKKSTSISALRSKAASVTLSASGMLATFLLNSASLAVNNTTAATIISTLVRLTSVLTQNISLQTDAFATLRDSSTTTASSTSGSNGGMLSPLPQYSAVNSTTPTTTTTPLETIATTVTRTISSIATTTTTLIANTNSNFSSGALTNFSFFNNDNVGGGTSNIIGSSHFSNISTIYNMNLSSILTSSMTTTASEGIRSDGSIVDSTVASAIATNTKLGDINFNESDEMMMTENATEYIFDRTDVRIIFITLYTLVFCCCFFGNLLVILVVTLSRRLRSITNFFLANLALADFCVGLFCVMQNLSIYLIDSWVFGEFLCRMYQFVHSLSYTASIFILVVICMERYFAIVHPITCKQILTAARLRIVILTVWITSAVYSTPKFVFSKTIKNIHTEDGQEEEICVLDRKMFNSKLLDMINFVLLYVIPLLVMTVLYSKIAIALWRSSRGLTHQIAQQQQQQQQQQQDNGSMSMHNSMYHHHLHHHHHHHPPHLHQHSFHQQHNHLHNHNTTGNATPSTPISMGSSTNSSLLTRKHSSKYEKRGVSITESQYDDYEVSLEADRPIVTACRKTSFYNSNQHLSQHQQQQQSQQHLQPRFSGNQRVAAHMSHSSSNVLRARRGVVRMLIIFVLTFALCNLPYHARKMWQYWSRSYRGDSNFNALLTPLTFLVSYFNSGVNPLLYAFLSRNFRKGMKELLLCSLKKGKGKSSSNSSMHHKRMALQTHSLPTDTTHIGNEQV